MWRCWPSSGRTSATSTSAFVSTPVMRTPPARIFLRWCRACSKPRGVSISFTPTTPGTHPGRGPTAMRTSRPGPWTSRQSLRWPEKQMPRPSSARHRGPRSPTTSRCCAHIFEQHGEALDGKKVTQLLDVASALDSVESVGDDTFVVDDEGGPHDAQAGALCGRVLAHGSIAFRDREIG